jgi:hypothetical protein
MTLNAYEDDRVFTQNAATFDHDPARLSELGINMLGSAPGFVQHRQVDLPP